MALFLGIFSTSIAVSKDASFPFFIYFDQDGIEANEPSYGGYFRVVLSQDEQKNYWVQDFQQIDFIDQYNPAITSVYPIDKAKDLNHLDKDSAVKNINQSESDIIYYHDNVIEQKPTLLSRSSNGKLQIVDLRQKKLLEGQYNNKSLRTGKWQAYDDTGKVLLTIVYDQSIPVSWTWYDYDGSLLSQNLPRFKPQTIELKEENYYFNKDGLMLARYPNQPYTIQRMILSNDEHGILIQDYDAKNQPVSDAYYLQCDDIASALKVLSPNCTVGAELSLVKDGAQTVNLLKGSDAIGWHYAFNASNKTMLWEPLNSLGQRNGLAIQVEKYYRGLLLGESQYKDGNLLHAMIRDIVTQKTLEETIQFPENSKFYYSVKYSGDEPYLSEYFYFSEDGQRVLHGPQTIWTNYANQVNRIESLKDYEHGKLNGRAYEYSSDGTFLTKEEYYQNDESSGTWTEKSKKDVINYQSIWVQPGKFVIRYSYLSDGTVQEIPMLDGQRHGEFRILDQDGKVLETMPYVKGKQEGISHGVYSNGERYANNYHNDQRDGEHRIWHANGILKRLSFYDKGWSIGIHKLWDIDGNLIEESEYVPNNESKSKRVRKTKWWKNGNKKLELTFENTYDDGTMKSGIITEWFSNGQLKKIIKTDNGECFGLVQEYDENQKMRERKCLDSERYMRF